jgi:hypothetical protein
VTDTLPEYTSLPEDLEPVVIRKTAKADEMRVYLNPTNVALSEAALVALSKPMRIEFLFGQQSRMLAVRPCASGGRKLQFHRKATGAFLTAAASIIAPLKLPPDLSRSDRAFPAHLVEGALLIGPLPEAKP